MSGAEPRVSPGSYARLDPREEAATLRKQLPDGTFDNGASANNFRKELWHANEAAPWAINSIYENLKGQAPNAPVALSRDASGKEYLYMTDAFAPVGSQTSGSLFSTRQDSLMSINAMAASRYAHDSAFQESLIAVAARTPEALLNAVQENADGSVTVRFPGAKDVPINVSADRLAQAAAKNPDAATRDGWRGTWPLAFMEAYRDYSNQHGTSANQTEKQFWKQDVGVERTEEALKLLTGKEVGTERVRYGMLPVSRSATIQNLLETQDKNHSPSIMYDEGYKTARAIWNYAPQKKEVWSTVNRNIDYDMTGMHPRFAFDPQVLVYVK